MSAQKRKGGRYTPPSDFAKVRRQQLREARAQFEDATRAARLAPDDHELRAKAFALGATVKLIEGMTGPGGD